MSAKSRVGTIGLQGIFALLFILIAASGARASTGWSTQDYDLYAGDFDGDGKADILYIAKDPTKPSGIAKADSSGGPNTPWQSWPSNYLGISWYGNLYTVIVADFNGDGKADVFLQSNIPGDSYLLLTNAQGKLVAISQTVAYNAAGVVWSADQHHIVAGDFNGDGKADLFLQATTASGLNAVMLADANGLFTAAGPAESWNDGYVGLNWAVTEANVFAGDFNGDGKADLLIQAKPKFVTIDYDIPFPIPTYPPSMNGFVPSQGGALFSATGVQRWSRNAFGMDWSPATANIVVGAFDRSTCSTCTDLILQGKGPGTTSYLVKGNASGAIFSTGTVLAANVTWTAGSYRLVAASFNGSTANAGIYFQSTSSGGTDYFADDVTGTTVTVTAHDTSQATGVVPATAVGKTDGSFAVSNTGAATYSIPIVVPPGVGGLQPNLTLSYQSGAGNGTAGVGWGLSGLSEIERCRKTIAEDGTTAAVAMSSADVFCLDGNKLRLTSGTYGVAGSVYQTELEQFSRVTAYGSAGNGPAYFVVEGKDGLQYEYGYTADSRVLSLNPSATTTARVWALDKVTDAVGNTMTFVYQNDGSPNGSYRPLEIDYTSNSSASLAAAYKVKLVWDSRPGSDVLSSYIGGGRVAETYRLNHIETQYNDPQVGGFRLVRKYQLSYNTSGVTPRSRLESIQECDRSGYCLAPTMIGWQEGQTGWSATETLSASDPSGVFGASYSIDVNGDGRSDLVYPQSVGGTYYWFLMLANPAGGYLPPVNTNIQSGDASKYTLAMPIDYYSKGSVELLATIPGYSTQQLLQWNGSITSPNLVQVNTNISTAQSTSQWVGDFDGDGRVDYLYSTNNGATDTIYVQLNTGLLSGTATFGGAQSVGTVPVTGNAYLVNPSVGGQATPLSRTFDFNGDGRTDIVYAYSSYTCNTQTFSCTYAETMATTSSGALSRNSDLTANPTRARHFHTARCVEPTPSLTPA